MKKYLIMCGKKCWHWLIGLTLVTAWLLIVGVIGMLIYPYDTIDVLEQPLPVEPKMIQRGSSDYQVKVHYIKHIDADIHTARHVECGNTIINLTPVERNFPVGEGVVYMNHTQIPTSTPLGECKLVYTVNYQVNPIRIITQRFETEMFTVIE